MPSGTDLLLQVPCLAGVDIAELERIPLRRVEFAAGEWVFTPHSPSLDLFFIAEGAVEIFDAARPDELRRVSRAVPGDVLGEHRQGRRPPAWAARAVGAAVLLRWPAAELASFLTDHPEVRDGLTFLTASRRLAATMGFAWLAQDETIYGVARKHPALLARALLLPLLALSAGLGTLAAGGLNASGLAAAAGAVVALATRSPGESAFDFQSFDTPRSYAMMPFMAALALIASIGAENTGIASAEAAFVPVAAVTVVAHVFYNKLPTLAPNMRRVLMAPCVLVCAGIFNGTMADVFDSVDVGDLFSAAGGDARALFGVLALLVLFSLPFYMMFVFAPRQIADSEGTWSAWAARYGLFLVGAIAGVGWLAAIGS